MTKTAKNIILTIVLVTVFAIIIPLGTYLTVKMVTRKKATINDIKIVSESIDIIEVGATLTFRPLVDIEDLEITIKFQNSRGIELQTIKKNFRSVQKGKSYTITIKIRELNSTVIYNIADVECLYTVSGGYYYD